MQNPLTIKLFQYVHPPSLGFRDNNGRSMLTQSLQDLSPVLLSLLLKKHPTAAYYTVCHNISGRSWIRNPRIFSNRPNEIDVLSLGGRWNSGQQNNNGSRERGPGVNPSSGCSNYRSDVPVCFGKPDSDASSDFQHSRCQNSRKFDAKGLVSKMIQRLDSTSRRSNTSIVWAQSVWTMWNCAVSLNSQD